MVLVAGFDAQFQVIVEEARQREVRTEHVIVAEGNAAFELHPGTAIEEVMPEPAAEADPGLGRPVGVAVLGEEAVMRGNQPADPAFLRLHDQFFELFYFVGLQLRGFVGALLFEHLGPGLLSGRSRRVHGGCNQGRGEESHIRRKHYYKGARPT